MIDKIKMNTNQNGADQNANNSGANNNGEQHSNRSGNNDSYSEENSLGQQQQQPLKVKLPRLGKIKFSNVGIENKNNSIVDYNSNNNCTQYLKGVSMSKKMNMLKQKYVSPYSQKVIFNLPKHN